MGATKNTFCCITVMLLCMMTTVCYSRAIVEEKHLSDATDSNAANRAARSVQHLPYALRLCAFNIKTFGISKMSDTEVADIITQVIS